MNPILNAKDVAELLHCSVKTVEDKARSGELPGEKFGESWVFPAAALLWRVNEIAIENAAARRLEQQQPGLADMARVAQHKPRRKPLVDLSRLTQVAQLPPAVGRML